ncbi:MAG TPA: DinB family protein [Anaerolineales bacterium]
MPELSLFQSVEQFAEVAHPLSDADLETRWVWEDYDEGIRFAFFRTYEQLRQLAADLVVQRGQAGPPFSSAERALAVYYAAYRDLQALMTGVSDEQARVPPAEGEWPLVTIVDHVVEATRGFFAVISYTLQGIRAGESKPRELSEESWIAFWAGDDYRQASESGKLSELLAYYERMHRRVLRELGDISEDEIYLPSVYWETNPMTVQFRLHRFDSHLRQHTIQVEKALDALGGPPSEARRLLRLIYAALAEAEGALLNAPGTGLERQQEVARQIVERSAEIARLTEERN